MKNKTSKIIGSIIILLSIFLTVIFLNISIGISQNYLKGSLTPDSVDSLIPDPIPVTEGPVTVSGSYFDCIADAYYDMGMCFSRCDASDDGGIIEELVRIGCINGCYHIFYFKSALCLFQ